MEGFLENFSLDHRYGPMKTALNELGFIVNFVEKLAQKTVITVSHYEKGNKNPAFTEEQEANDHEVSREF
jgi:hypothetical protein